LRIAYGHAPFERQERMFYRSRIQTVGSSPLQPALPGTFGCYLCITFDGENPFDANWLSARWRLDEAPDLISLNAGHLLLHGFDPLIFLCTVYRFLERRLFIHRLSGRIYEFGNRIIDDFGRLLNGNYIVNRFGNGKRRYGWIKRWIRLRWLDRR